MAANISDTRAILERVVAKATALRESTFLRELEAGQWHITFRNREVLVKGPSAEARNAFLLTFRFFIVRNEATSFRALAELCNEPTVSAQWKERLEAIRNEVQALLETSWGSYKYGGQSRSFSNREIMDTFLNGGWVHANNADTVARFQEWNRYPGIVAFLELRFVMTIRGLCSAIFLLAEECEDELNRTLEP